MNLLNDWVGKRLKLKERYKEGDEELLLIHYNKQRIKSFKELINEYLILDRYYRKGQGRRTDLTSVKSNKGSSRDMVSKELGISSSQLRRLVFIHKNKPEYIELLDKGILTLINLIFKFREKLKKKNLKNLLLQNQKVCKIELEVLSEIL